MTVTTWFVIAVFVVAAGAAAWFFLLDSRRAAPIPAQTPGRHRRYETARGTARQIDSQQYLTLPIRFGPTPTIWTPDPPTEVHVTPGTDLEKADEVIW